MKYIAESRKLQTVYSDISGLSVNGIRYGISSKKVDELSKKPGEIAVSSAGVGGVRTARVCVWWNLLKI